MPYDTYEAAIREMLARSENGEVAREVLGRLGPGWQPWNAASHPDTVRLFVALLTTAMDADLADAIHVLKAEAPDSWETMGYVMREATRGLVTSFDAPGDQPEPASNDWIVSFTVTVRFHGDRAGALAFADEIGGTTKGVWHHDEISYTAEPAAYRFVSLVPATDSEGEAWNVSFDGAFRIPAPTGENAVSAALYANSEGWWGDNARIIEYTVSDTAVATPAGAPVIYAYPYDTVQGRDVAHQGHGAEFPFVANAWYAQLGGRWMAVVRDWEPEDLWFGPEGGNDPDAVWPEPRTFPITERPPTGTLLYRRADATEVTEAIEPEDFMDAKAREFADLKDSGWADGHANHKDDELYENHAAYRVGWDAARDHLGGKPMELPACNNCGERSWRIDGDIRNRAAIVITPNRSVVHIDRCGPEDTELLVVGHVECTCGAEPDEATRLAVCAKADAVILDRSDTPTGDVTWRILYDYREF